MGKFASVKFVPFQLVILIADNTSDFVTVDSTIFQIYKRI